MINPNSELFKYLPKVIEQATNGIVVSDPNQEDNPVVYVNDITCKRFEYTKEEFLGRNCRFLQGEDRNQKNIKAIKDAIKNCISTTVTVKNYSKSGKLIYNQFTISPIFDENNNLKYFLGIQRDVTKEVTLEKQNFQLQKEKIEDAQYNAIGKLTGGISHEINTPLTIINGTMEFLKDSIQELEQSPLKQNIIQDLEDISIQLNKIKNLTESMREIADTKTFEIKKINIYRALIISLRLTHNKTKHITKVNLLNENFSLDIDREKYMYYVNGDARKLEQVFIAIIDNALDQLKMTGTIQNNKLDISLQVTKDNTTITFEDNGGGIDENLLEDIYKPFKSNKEHKGLGIGLSIAKKIIDQHNFIIDISNNQNGAIVKIEIPH
ncbi:MAG: PAS domain-containing protein [Arcobacteraceae bacterium]|nr:PAS domain-containing protein [Arcobacteraceae bacterium]